MLDIRFLNVGHGDCTLIKFPSGRLMMIDVNNSKTLPDADIEAIAENKGLSVYQFEKAQYLKGAYRSWEDYYRSLLVDPAKYIKEHFPGEGLFRYVQTHPDMDHMSGLFNLFWSEQVALENFWTIDHEKSFTEADFENSPFEYADWLMFEYLSAGNTRDGKVNALRLNQADQGSYWNEDGISILSPTRSLQNECKESGDYNNASYVLRIEHAGRVVILPGDVEGRAWREILATTPEHQLSCDVLKAAHHGRESGYHKEAVEAMDPSVVICSVGKKPSTDASDEYASHGCAVLSTRYHGTLRVRIWDDGDVWVDNYQGERIQALT